MPKLQLPKSELEKFLSLASYADVTPDSISYSPITEYILVSINKGFCKMTLTSQNTFISNMFSINNSESKNLLISYLDLKDFFKANRGEQISINESEKKITISDGIFTKNYSKKEGMDINLFPKQPNFSGKEFKRFGKKVVDLLVQSKKFIKEEKKDSLIPGLNHVQLLNSNLLSSDAHISFYYKLDESVGEYKFFSKSEIDLIKNFDYFDFINFDNWNVIKYKTISFCRRNKENTIPVLFEQIEKYSKIIDKSSYIKIPVEQLFNFCKSVIDTSKDKIVNSYINVIFNGIELTYSDIQNSDDAHQVISCEVKGFEIGYKICFVQANIIKVLDSLESKTINLSECVEGNGFRQYIAFWLESDPSFYSICSKGFEVQSESIIQENVY